MAALNFPDAPVNGQKFPASPQPGVANYVWDGEKWTTAGFYPMAGVPEAPADGQQYARQDKGWSVVTGMPDVIDAGVM